jgi:hypothetical protein
MLYAMARRSGGACVLIAAVITGVIDATAHVPMAKPNRGIAGISERVAASSSESDAPRGGLL